MKLKFNIQEFEKASTTYLDLKEELEKNQELIEDKILATKDYWMGSVSEAYYEYFSNSFSTGKYASCVETIDLTYKMMLHAIPKATELSAQLSNMGDHLFQDEKISIIKPNEGVFNGGWLDLDTEYLGTFESLIDLISSDADLCITDFNNIANSCNGLVDFSDIQLGINQANTKIKRLINIKEEMADYRSAVSSFIVALYVEASRIMPANIRQYYTTGIKNGIDETTAEKVSRLLEKGYDYLSYEDWIYLAGAYYISYNNGDTDVIKKFVEWLSVNELQEIQYYDEEGKLQTVGVQVITMDDTKLKELMAYLVGEYDVTANSMIFRSLCEICDNPLMYQTDELCDYELLVENSELGIVITYNLYDYAKDDSGVKKTSAPKEIAAISQHLLWKEEYYNQIYTTEDISRYEVWKNEYMLTYTSQEVASYNARINYDLTSSLDFTNHDDFDFFLKNVMNEFTYFNDTFMENVIENQEYVNHYCEEYWNNDANFPEYWYGEDSRIQEAMAYLVIEALAGEKGLDVKSFTYRTNESNPSNKVFALEKLLCTDTFCGYYTQDLYLTLENSGKNIVYNGPDIEYDPRTGVLDKTVAYYYFINNDVYQSQMRQNGRDVVSVTLDFMPVVGEIKMAVEGISGHDYISGRKLSGLQRVVCITFSVLNGIGLVMKFAKAKKAASAITEAGKAIDSGENAVKAVENEFSEAEVVLREKYLDDVVSYENKATNVAREGASEINTIEDVERKVADVYSGKGACFIEGTKISTIDGEVTIENICVGDYVLAGDPTTGDVAYQKVLEIYRKETDTLVHVTLENEEEIVTTLTHPFYVNGEGWIEAGDLLLYDQLLDANGNIIQIKNIWVENLDEQITVYNFAVEDYHTYYVGDTQILVHNTCSQGGVGNSGASAIEGSTGSTGTVWDYITPTQENYPHTNIPRSFEIEVNGDKMWVHGNATEHIYDDVYKGITAGKGTAYTNPNLYTQKLMSDFYGSLQEATKSGIVYGKNITQGNWEFIFSQPRQDGLLPVVKHSQFNGWH